MPAAARPSTDRSTTWCAQGGEQVEAVRGEAVADRGDVGSLRPEELDEGRPDGSGGAVDEGPVAGAQVRDPQAGVRVVPALGGAGRRLEVEVVRHPQHQAVGRDRNQLGVRARSAVDEARDALALVPPVDALAEGLDHPGVLGSEHRHPRSRPPADEPVDPRAAGAVGGVRPVDRRRVDPDEQLARAGGGVGDRLVAEDVGSAVP